MKIAFVGKGGAGKSTVSWLMSCFLADRGIRTLSIDADYNMDLTHNLGYTKESIPHRINQAEPDFYRYLGLSEKEYYVDLPAKENLAHFSLEPMDWFTRKYAHEVAPNLNLMVAGMTPEEMLYGHRCGHAYVSSLKYYLPLLEKQKEDVVIIDSTAGTDLVSYGMYLGADAVIVVVEETPHSIGVHDQIKTICDEFKIPVFIVVNKYRGLLPAKEFLEKNVDRIVAQFPFDASILGYDFSQLSPEILAQAEKLTTSLRNMSFDTTQQWGRHKEWKRRYDEQMSESKKKEFTFAAGKAGHG